MWAHVNVINNFAYKMNLQNVTIYLNATSTSYDSVPSGMFENSSALQRVRIVGQDGLSHGHTIGANAFKNCTHLSVLDLEYSNVYTIYGGAFEGSAISNVIIPDFIYKIYPSAFHTNIGASASFPDSTWKLSKDGASDAYITVTHSGTTQSPSTADMAYDLMGVDGYTMYTDRTWERTQ